eukprot:scaffold14815_cov53-Phaeocystis_antarctica.AAC.4
MWTVDQGPSKARLVRKVCENISTNLCFLDLTFIFKEVSLSGPGSLALCKLRPARISGRYLRPAEGDILSRVVLPVDAHAHAHAPRLGAARRHEAAHAVGLPRVGNDAGGPLQRRGHDRLAKLAAVRAVAVGAAQRLA